MVYTIRIPKNTLVMCVSDNTIGNLDFKNPLETDAEYRPDEGLFYFTCTTIDGRTREFCVSDDAIHVLNKDNN